jgi:hypothetical protein
MFAHDLCHSQIEYLSNSIDFNKKDRAKRYHKYSIFNIQFRLVRVGFAPIKSRSPRRSLQAGGQGRLKQIIYKKQITNLNQKPNTNIGTDLFGSFCNWKLEFV